MLFSYISKTKKLDNKDLGPFIVKSVIMVGWLAHAHAASHQHDKGLNSGAYSLPFKFRFYFVWSSKEISCIVVKVQHESLLVW